MTKISTKSGKQRNIEENYVISNPLTFSVKTYKDIGLDISTGREYTIHSHDAMKKNQFFLEGAVSAQFKR